LQSAKLYTVAQIKIPRSKLRYLGNGINFMTKFTTLIFN